MQCKFLAAAVPAMNEVSISGHCGRSHAVVSSCHQIRSRVSLYYEQGITFSIESLEISGTSDAIEPT